MTEDKYLRKAKGKRRESRKLTISYRTVLSTRVKLKVLSAKTGKTISQLLDDCVDGMFEAKKNGGDK